MTARRAIALLLGLAPVVAGAQIYRCEGPGGVVEYSNAPSGPDRSCRQIDLPAVTTIPAPRLPPAAAPAPAPASAAQAQPRPGGAAQAAGSSAGFPRVDTAAQKTRDSERRRILEDELRKEEGRLAELRKEYNNGEPERRGDERNYQRYLDRVQRLKDEIARAESATASLRRELASIRD